MSREIKFRQAIFHPVTKEFLRWHYWGLVNRAFVGVDTGWCSPEQAVKNSQQYIGLPDKNSVEIYEGDIIKWTLPKGFMHPTELEEIWADTTTISRVVFSKGNYELQGVGGDSGWRTLLYGDIPRNEYGEVIGNIYENSSLLEK